MTTKRRYAIRTYGCQMNVHDSEKLSHLLDFSGLVPASEEADADVLVINTCSIRDKAEQHLYSDLGRLREWKAERPGRLVGVGGCVAQQVGDGILKRFPQVDFVFGTHNLRLVPAMVASGALGQRTAEVSENRSLERFDLPERAPSSSSATPGRAFITVMEGCDMFCSFCIVPQTRGRELSRPAASILEEVERRVDEGVSEITLLGQTVNAYGRHEARRGHGESAGTLPFSVLLGKLDALAGLRRIRYTSPHPMFFDTDLVSAHGTLESLAPHVHLPLQSGSDPILEKMRRRYTAQEFLDLVSALRASRADVAITTDLIVGFPGESEADFRRTLAVVAEAGFVDHYSFKYSPRPGTAAADLTTDTVGPAEAQARLEELQALQRGLTLAYHRSRVGADTEILVEGPSRRGGGQFCGRDPYHRVVNLTQDPEANAGFEPGQTLPVKIVDATPHSLIGLPAARAREQSLQVIGQAVPLA